MADNVAERRHFQGAMWERNNWERNSKEVCKELNLLYRTAQLRGGNRTPLGLAHFLLQRNARNHANLNITATRQQSATLRKDTNCQQIVRRETGLWCVQNQASCSALECFLAFDGSKSA
jgi:hypothetical protein